MKKVTTEKEPYITEKAFWQGIVVSAVSLLLCILAFSAGTYAWFISDVTSNNNALVSGSFDLLVTVTKQGAEGEILEIPTDEGAKGWRYTLPADGEEVTYTITLKLTDQATVKGHCVVTIGDSPARHTEPIIGISTSGADALSPDQLTDPLVFTLTVSETVVVTLEPCWGISAADSVIRQGDDLVLTPAVTEPDTSDDETESETDNETEAETETEAEFETETDTEVEVEAETETETETESNEQA